ncbi:MAG: leucyl aminopeptidase [Synergistaceae bacterium]|nr:leucyl aminopeptidase [Synergistaceae bacterium]
MQATEPSLRRGSAQSVSSPATSRGQLMQIKRCSESQVSSLDSMLVLLREEDCENLAGLSLNEDIKSIIKALIARKDFKAKKGSLLRVPLVEGNLYLSGLGKSEKCTVNVIRDALTHGLRTIGRANNHSVCVVLSHLKGCSELGFALGEASGLCSYTFDKYKSKDKDYEPFALESLFTDIDEPEEFSRGQKFAAAQIYSRELANEPGCVINPESLAQKARELAKEFNLECEVWDEKRLESERTGALLAVGSGSKNPPRLIHLIYKPANPIKKIAIVGKGITFDSGGLNIKPDNYMLTMKGDKTGACNVLAIMKAVSELGLNIEVHGIMAAAENMPSGSSYRPDDIIRARNGKTIEINNTDAEGRLVLADALCVASELKPDAIIDIATLTGACAVALGKHRAGLFVNDDALAEKLLASSTRRGEPYWRMPLEDEFIAESLKSPYADLINAGERYGGAIFAALFLQEFVGEKIPWAHMDIAGTDFNDKEYGVYSKGASAFGVRTCLDYLMRL